jgi:hypothetical protein
VSVNKALSAVVLCGSLVSSRAAPPIAVEARQVGTTLEMRVVGQSVTPVLLTFRTGIGAYFEVAIHERGGTAVKYLGRVVAPSKPAPCDLHLLDEGQFFGTRISLRSEGAFMLEPGKDYEGIVSYMDREAVWSLSDRQKGQIRKTRGPFVELRERVRAHPVLLRID